MQNNEIRNTSNVNIELRQFVKFENKECDSVKELDNSITRNGKTMVKMNTEEKLNKATAKLILKLTKLNNEEFEQAVADMTRQIQILPDNERMICNNYYLNMFDIARELRKNGFTA